MKSVIKIIFFLLWVFNNGMANVIENSYAATYDWGNIEKVYSVCHTTDNYYIMAGYTNSFGAGNNDVLVIKLHPYLYFDWAKAFGGENNDYAYSIQQTTYGEYIVAGKTNSFGANDYNILVINLSSTGSINWSKTINRLGDDVAYSIKQTISNDYIIAGCSSLDTNSEVFVIKLNYNGDLIWAKTFGDLGNDEAYSIEETNDGYIVVGRTNSFSSNYDVLVIKLSHNGNLLWAKTFGLEGNDEAYSIQKTNDGGYIVVGRTNSFGPDYDVLVIKLDNNGNLLWAKIFDGLGGDDEGYSIQNTTGYEYVVVGKTHYFDTGYDVFAMKLDNMGNLVGTKIFNYSQNEQAYSISTQDMLEYGYMIVGFTTMNTEDVLFIKTYDELQMPPTCPWWERAFTTTTPNFSINEVFDTIPDTFSVQIDIVTLMDTSLLTSPFVICEARVEEIGFTPTPVYLDAFSTVGKNFHIGFGIPYKARVRLEIFDIKGSLEKLLLDRNLEPGKYIMDVNLSLKEGTYFLVLKLIDKKKQKEVKKLIFIK